MAECQFYQSWSDHGVQISQCLEYWQGLCHEPMSPHDGQDCPWPNGYPCAPRMDNPAPLIKEESALAGPVGVNVARLLGIKLPEIEPHG